MASSPSVFYPQDPPQQYPAQHLIPSPSPSLLFAAALASASAADVWLVRERIVMRAVGFLESSERWKDKMLGQVLTRFFERFFLFLSFFFLFFLRD